MSYSKNLHYTWKASTNTNTIDYWKKAGIEVVEEEREDAEGKTRKVITRPDIDIEIDMPTAAELLEEAKGEQFVQKLIEQAIHKFVGTKADANDLENIGEVLTIENLLASVTEKPKASALKASKEEMQRAALVFQDYLGQIGKSGAGVVAQVQLFGAKFVASKTQRFADDFFQRGADKEKVLEIMDAILDNLDNFLTALRSQEGEEAEETLMDCEIPTLICIQNLEAWKVGTEQVKEDDMLDVDSF